MSNLAVSGRRVSCDLKKGQFVYLICRDPENPEKKLFIPESDVLDQVKAIFQSFHLPQDLLAALTDHLKTSHDTEKGFHKQAIASLRKEYDTMGLRLSRSIGTTFEYAGEETRPGEAGRPRFLGKPER